jgi:DMSO/TMAO reductase YedYZ molybdopterin-dependent catalytic subunit
VVDDFPVLTAGETPRVPLETWDFKVVDQVGRELARWSWVEFLALPSEDVKADIHCVTKWSKLATKWTGVSADVLLAGIDTDAAFVLAFAEGEYTTNIPLADLLDGKAWVAYRFDGDKSQLNMVGPPDCSSLTSASGKAQNG